MADQFPVEIWERILSLACTDDGSTGRSLSLVSRYVRDVSSPFKLQSIALSGYGQQRRFADMLERHPPHLRRVRHLCVSHQVPRISDLTAPVMRGENVLVQACLFNECSTSQNDQIMRIVQENPAWMNRVKTYNERCRAEFAKSVSRVLHAVAPDIQTLAFELTQISSLELFNMRFPSLVELTLQGASSLLVQALWARKVALYEFPSLKYLHLSTCGFHLPAFMCKIPALTQCRVSGLMLQPTDRVLRTIRTAISPPPVDGSVPEAHAELSHVERFIIQPGTKADHFYRPGDTERFYDALILQDWHHSRKIVALKIPDRGGEYKWTQAKEDWMERVCGGSGCWKEDYDRSELHTQSAANSNRATQFTP